MKPLPYNQIQTDNSKNLKVKKSNKVSENNVSGNSLFYQFLVKTLGLGAIFLFICLLANIYGYLKQEKLLMQIRSLPSNGFSCTPEQFGQDVLKTYDEEFSKFRGFKNRKLVNPGLADLGTLSRIQYNGLPINTLIQELSFFPLNTANWEIRQEGDFFFASCIYQIHGKTSFDAFKKRSKQEIELAIAQSMLIRRQPTFAVQLEILAGNNKNAALKADSLMHVNRMEWENTEEILYQLSLMRTLAYFNVLTKDPKFSWTQEYKQRLKISINETKAKAKGDPERECQFSLLLSEIQWKSELPEKAFNTLVDAIPLHYKIENRSLSLAYKLRLNNNLISYDYQLHPSEQVYTAGIAWITQKLDDLIFLKPTNIEDADWAAIQQARGLLYSTRAELQALLDPSEENRIISDIHMAMMHDKTFHFDVTLNEYRAYKIILPILARDSAFCADLMNKPDELAFIKGSSSKSDLIENDIASDQSRSIRTIQTVNSGDNQLAKDTDSSSGENKPKSDEFKIQRSTEN